MNEPTEITFRTPDADLARLATSLDPDIAEAAQAEMALRRLAGGCSPRLAPDWDCAEFLRQTEADFRP